MKQKLTIEGVGTGTNEAHEQLTFPLAFQNGERGSFTSPVVENSELPALLGLESLEQHKAIIDTNRMLLIFPGPAGIRMLCSPGTVVHKLEKSMTGHLLLPITEWTQAKHQSSMQKHQHTVLHSAGASSAGPLSQL